VESREWGKDSVSDSAQGQGAVCDGRVVESWRGEEGEALESCTIIVTDANALVDDIHDRMPVILAGQDCAG